MARRQKRLMGLRVVLNCLDGWVIAARISWLVNANGLER
jgi:hypothetical protein